MPEAPSFSPQLLGETEKTLNAILDRQLAGTELTELHWIALSLTVADGGASGRDALVHRIAGGLKVGEAAAQALIDELISAQLVHAAGDEDSRVTPTDAGRQLHGRIRAAVVQITERLWGDLPPEELATAGRVLSTVLARANAELAGAGVS
jgi:hypothetical protein